MTDMVLERVAAPISTTRNRRLRFTRLAPAALGFPIAIGGMKYGYDWWRVGRFIETTDDAYAGGNITPVSPHAAGFISEILVADNQRVAADQLLIRIDPRDFRAALNHARAFADERQASLASLEAKYVLQQQMVTQAEADLAAKTAKAGFASADAIRYRNLARPVTEPSRVPSGPWPPIKKPSRQSKRPRLRLPPLASGFWSCRRTLPRRARLLLRQGPTSKLPSSISATPKSALPSTAMLAIGPEESEPM